MCIPNINPLELCFVLRKLTLVCRKFQMCICALMFVRSVHGIKWRKKKINKNIIKTCDTYLCLFILYVCVCFFSSSTLFTFVKCLFATNNFDTRKKMFVDHYIVIWKRNSFVEQLHLSTFIGMSTSLFWESECIHFVHTLRIKFQKKTAKKASSWPVHFEMRIWLASICMKMK